MNEKTLKYKNDMIEQLKSLEIENKPWGIPLLNKIEKTMMEAKTLAEIGSHLAIIKLSVLMTDEKFKDVIDDFMSEYKNSLLNFAESLAAERRTQLESKTKIKN